MSETRNPMVATMNTFKLCYGRVLAHQYKQKATQEQEGPKKEIKGHLPNLERERGRGVLGLSNLRHWWLNNLKYLMASPLGSHHFKFSTLRINRNEPTLLQMHGIIVGNIHSIGPGRKTPISNDLLHFMMTTAAKDCSEIPWNGFRQVASSWRGSIIVDNLVCERS